MFCYDAFSASGTPGYASGASVQDNQMTGFGPFRFGCDRAEMPFDCIRVFRIGEFKQIGDAPHMRVDRESGNTECISQDDIRGLSSDSRQ